LYSKDTFTPDSHPRWTAAALVALESAQWAHLRN
jgi:hypothetical protein